MKKQTLQNGYRSSAMNRERLAELGNKYYHPKNWDITPVNSTDFVYLMMELEAAWDTIERLVKEGAKNEP
jgi:hypothetical protein